MMADFELLRIPNFGRKSLNELHELFKQVGIVERKWNEDKRVMELKIRGG